MTGRIIITGISDAEKAAKEILEHIHGSLCHVAQDGLVRIRYSDCAGQQGRSRQRQLTASC